MIIALTELTVYKKMNKNTIPTYLYKRSECSAAVNAVIVQLYPVIPFFPLGKSFPVIFCRSELFTPSVEYICTCFPLLYYANRPLRARSHFIYVLLSVFLQCSVFPSVL